MARRKSSNDTRKRPRFLPEGLSSRAKAVVLRLFGIVGLLALGTLALALITYDENDPSASNATDAIPSNIVGNWGAWTADFMLQWFGYSVIVPLLIFLAWFLRYTAGRPVLKVWLRGVVVLCVMLLASIFFAGNGDTETAMPAGTGGVFGELLLARSLTVLASAGVSVETEWLLPMLAFLLWFPLALWALAIERNEWQLLRNGVQRVLGGLAGQTRGLKLPDVKPAAAGVPVAGRGGATRQEPVFNDPDRGDSAPAPQQNMDELAASYTPQDFQESAPVVEPAATDVPPRKKVTIGRKAASKAGKKDLESRQKSLLPDSDNAAEGYNAPPLDVLAMPPAEVQQINDIALEQNARMLEGVLADFGVQGEIKAVHPGPVVTLYEFDPVPGTKSSRVIGLASDIARSMSAIAVRIATIPGHPYIGIEIPNQTRETVFFRELIGADEFGRHKGHLVMALGKDIGGKPEYVDLAGMPHLLIAGTTGSGKSVAVNTMILSLLYRLSPEQCRFIMVDPKMLELSVYDGIPHLLSPVVTDPGKAVAALKWAVKEMDDRYRAMSQLGVRNIAGYNKKLKAMAEKGESFNRTVQTGFDAETGQPIYEEQEMDLTPLPYIVVIVDEMADLMMTAGKEVEGCIMRLAQKARAAGLHLIVATQRPSVDVITGTIKANFPTRISFSVTTKIDSRTILGEQGAEQLLGRGDMLYMANGGRITRLHGPFASDEEVEAVTSHLKAIGEPNYVEGVTEDQDDVGAEGGEKSGDSTDPLFDQIVAFVAKEQKASTSFVQRHFNIGYNRAARIIDDMEAQGMISKADHVGKRKVLLPPTSEI
jgi:S-DNA-T family DNA segregation ATPase FtsK/SpoIIIE